MLSTQLAMTGLRLAAILIGIRLFMDFGATYSWMFAGSIFGGGGIPIADFLIPLGLVGAGFLIPLLLLVFTKPLARLICPPPSDPDEETRPINAEDIEAYAIAILGLFWLSVAAHYVISLAAYSYSQMTEEIVFETHKSLIMFATVLNFGLGSLFVRKARPISKWIRRQLDR